MLSANEVDSKFSHIYVHLPFCESICHYCDFYVARVQEADHDRLFAALTKETSLWSQNIGTQIRSIYLGGGTPSESPEQLIARFLQVLSPQLSADYEITIEVNPSSVNIDKLLAWKDAGINRISLGVQSLNDSLLKRLGRVHSAVDARAAIEICTKHFSNVSVDFIYGIPGQSVDDLVESTSRAVDLGINHLSAYTLTLQKKHFLSSKLPSNDETASQSEALRQALDKRGFFLYEASNYSLPGKESQHNQCYWQSKPYLALGPSAHGHDGKHKRWKNLANWRSYCEALENGLYPIDSVEVLSIEQRIIEFLFTRLRCRNGIKFSEFNDLFGKNLWEEKQSIFSNLIKSGLGRIEDQAWIPSFAGILLADEICLQLSI